MGLTLSSQEVAPGYLFIARRGVRDHGFRYLNEAIQRGAVAVLYDPRGAPAPVSSVPIPLVALPELDRHLGEVARRFYGAQRLVITAVTGTNGKTTVAWLLAQAWQALGVRASYLGTLGLIDGSRRIPSERTTPDVISMHAMTAKLADEGTEYLICEASSHALIQGRLDGLIIETAVFTNLSAEHLDYHQTLEGYREAKWRLFERPELRRAIINVADETGAMFASRLQGRCVLVVGYALEGPAEFMARDIRVRPKGTEFILLSPKRQAFPVQTALIGGFNVENLLAVTATLHATGISMRDIAKTLPTLTAPPGRFEVISVPRQPLVVVDFAHTPKALEAVLVACRVLTKGRLLVVFGCGGERDREKRPVMGRLAATHADRVVITDDNPRHEDPTVIVREILAGISPGDERVVVIHDRTQAIATAIAEAHTDDVVLVAGKGHEETQIYADHAIPFSDQAVARACLTTREKGSC